MKIAYSHLVQHIPDNPTIEQISEKLFQLGHEHEIENDILEMEFTPNRGDCLSLNGLLRDLSVFYELKDNPEEYNNSIDDFNLILKINLQEDALILHF
jgi:phenylalanyl-tRNA synthetase beta subunit